MGLLGKIKDILFEEEEEEVEDIKENIKAVEKPVEHKKEDVKREVKKEIKPEVATTNEIKVERKPVYEEPTRTATHEEFLGERDILNKESSPFLDFDEEEFSSLLTRPRNKTANVLEYERKKKTEKRTDYGRYERTEVKETVERKKFKPSPIISPVYGILNEDYRIEDIKSKNDTIDTLDIDKVRKKAFEPEIKEEPKVDYYEEETVTVKYEEPEEEKLKKGKTIDDLLEETSDEIISIDDNQEDEKSIEYEEPTKDIAIEKPFEEEIDDTKEIKEETDEEIESDLFDLIDSMYENREDGE